MKIIILSFLYFTNLILSGCGTTEGQDGLPSSSLNKASTPFKDGSYFCSKQDFITSYPKLVEAYCENEEMINKRFHYKKAFYILEALVNEEEFYKKLIAWKLIPVKKLNYFSSRSDEASTPREAIKNCQNSNNLKKCILEEFQSREQKVIDWSQKILADINSPGKNKEAIDLTEKLDGEYIKHEKGIIANIPKWEKESGNHRLVIKAMTDREVYYYLYIQFSNGHYCEREGIASYRLGNSFVDGKINPKSPHQSCALEIFSENDKIVINDRNSKCRLDSCGQRGNLSRIEFDLKTRTGNMVINKKLRNFYKAKKEGKESYFLIDSR